MSASASASILAYAQRDPTRVSGIVLVGVVTLTRTQEINWLHIPLAPSSPAPILGLVAQRIDRECGCGGGPLTGHASIVRIMNLTLAHLLAGVIADAADQLSGTPPESRTSVADRAMSCSGNSGAGGS